MTSFKFSGFKLSGTSIDLLRLANWDQRFLNSNCSKPDFSLAFSPINLVSSASFRYKRKAKNCSGDEGALQCQISASLRLLIFETFVGSPFPLIPPHPLLLGLPRLLNFLKKYSSPSKFNCSFFPEYCSTEIVIASSIFFVTYEFERF